MSRKLKALFIGLGSIGQRHLRNLKNIISENDLEIYAYRKRRNNLFIKDGKAEKVSDLSESYGFKEFNKLDDAFNQNPNVCFICNPSSHHIPIAIEAAKRSIHFFVEKPLAINNTRLSELQELVEKNKLITMVGFQTRFNPCVRGVKKILSQEEYGSIISARFNWSTYLPSHHPYEDYKKSYAAKDELGGGVVSCLSHELDLIHFFFGRPTSVYSVGGNLSNLEIYPEDTMSSLFSYFNINRNYPVQLHLTFAQGFEQRYFEILLDEATILCDLTRNSLQVINHKGDELINLDYTDFQRNDMFVQELENFIYSVDNNKQSFIPIYEAINSVEMITLIRESVGSKTVKYF